MVVSKDDNKYIYFLVGKNIRRIRKEKGLTQAQIANIVRYDVGTIANIENNSFQTFSLEFIYVLSKKLDVDINEFFVGLKEDTKDLVSIK